MDNIYEQEGQHTVGKMTEATLGGVEGVGIIDVVRGNHDEVVEVVGTWRLTDTADSDVSALQRAHESGEEVVYKGRLDDRKHAEQDHVEVRVRIVGVETYHYDEAEFEGDERDRTLYKLELVGELPYIDS